MAPSEKKINFMLKVAYLQRLYGVKIKKIEAMENLTLGAFKARPID
jgi:hypothetical protein